MTLAVDLLKHDPATGKDETVGRCRLDGAVAVCKGPEVLTATLAEGVLSYAEGRVVTPEDGHLFLEALVEVYRDPHFYAVAVE
jgi:hypothetical protein